jgi:DNA-binding transcriptional MerR regulator
MVSFLLMSPKPCTTKEAAKAIGISRATLQAWIKDGMIQPPTPTLEGAVAKRLWTKADIERARRFKGTLRPGPKGKKKAKS